MDDENTWYLVDGYRLTNVHDRARCEGRPCVVHQQTLHHMSRWPLHWREDRKIFERICDHGTGHPDPDQFDYWREIGTYDTEVIHGCCGCCAEEEDTDG